MLTTRGIEGLRKPGRYADGRGLYLVIRQSGSRSWVCRVQKGGKRRDFGLGGYPKLSLANARKLAADIVEQVHLGHDPLALRKAAATVPSFETEARARHAELLPGFRNRKHAAQWLSQLEAYAFPTLGALPVDKIDGAAVRDALLPIWLEKPETAKRVHQRFVDVLVFAAARGHRGEVPNMTAKALRMPPQKGSRGHFEAMQIDDVPGFLSRLKERETAARLALEFAILTAARSGEVRGATWQEIDLEAGLWAIPAERMKAGRAHVVPLSEAACDCIERARRHRRKGSNLIFSSPVKGGPLSDMALLKVMRDMDLKAVPHGFRSSFRDWAAERTSFPREVAEQALAHAIADKTEAAYRRGSLLEKRREMMAAWAAFCVPTGGSVVRLEGRRGGR